MTGLPERRRVGLYRGESPDGTEHIVTGFEIVAGKLRFQARCGAKCNDQREVPDPLQVPLWACEACWRT